MGAHLLYGPTNKWFRSRRQKPSLRPAGVLLRPTEDLFRPTGALFRSTWVHPETKKGPPKTDRGPPQVDRSASYTDKGPAIDRTLLRPTEALLRSAEALHILAKALPENDRDPPQIDTGSPQVIFFNGYEYTCLSENRSESRIAFFVLVMIFDSRHHYCYDSKYKIFLLTKHLQIDVRTR